MGQLHASKGVHNLVYAAKILKKKGIRDFVVVIAGKGHEKENLKKLITESNTEEHFRLLDFVSYDELPNIYNISDVFILPSYPTLTWQEQFGMVLIEAMACGKPVISTYSGSIPEVVGDAGLLISPGNFFQLADTILYIMDNKELGVRLGEKGRERVVMNFDAKKNALKFYNIYKDILNT